MKRFKVILMVGVMIFALSACGKDEDSKNNSNTESVASDTEGEDESKSDDSDGINIADMSYDDAKTYMDGLPTTDESLFEISTDGMPEGEAAIAAYNGEDKIVIVPDTIDGLKITKFNLWSFTNNENIVAVKAPSTLTVLDESTFANCLNLCYVTNLDNVKTIGNGAFIYTNVNYFEFSDSLTEVIGTWADYAFEDMTLKAPKDCYIVKYVKTINESFGKDVFEIIEY